MPRHGDLQVSFHIRGQLTGPIQRDTKDRAGKRERILILLGRRAIPAVAATSQALRAKDERDQCGISMQATSLRLM